MIYVLKYMNPVFGIDPLDIDLVFSDSFVSPIFFKIHLATENH